MSKYELVILLDSQLPMQDLNNLIASIENLIGTSSILDKDDIGILNLMTKINNQPKAYFISWYLQLDGQLIDKYKKELSIIKGITRYFFYKMSDKQTFFKFAEVEKKFIQSEEDKIKQKNENAFKEMDLKSHGKKKFN